MVDGEVFVRYLQDISLSVRGITVPNPDGTFSVYINASYPPEIQEAIYQHELYHIEHDHLYTYLPVTVAEAQADGKATEPSPPKPRRKRIRVRRLQKANALPFPDIDPIDNFRFRRAEWQWLYGNEY